MEFGEVLSRAWQIIWKHKVLWIFGILAGCGTASGGAGSNSGFRYSRPGEMPPFVSNLFQSSNQGLILAIVGVIIIVVLILIILSIILRHNWACRINPRYSIGRPECRTPSF